MSSKFRNIYLNDQNIGSGTIAADKETVWIFPDNGEVQTVSVKKIRRANRRISGQEIRLVVAR